MAVLNSNLHIISEKNLLKTFRVFDKMQYCCQSYFSFYSFLRSVLIFFGVDVDCHAYRLTLSYFSSCLLPFVLKGPVSALGP